MKRPWTALLSWLLSLLLAAGCGSGVEEPAPTAGPDPGGRVASTAPESPVAVSASEAAESPAGGPSPPAGGPRPTGPVTAFAEAAAEQPGYEEVSALEPPADLDPARGQKIYASRCATCHGEDGSKPGPGGMGLEPPPRDLTNPAAYRYGADLKGIFRTDKYGIADSPMTPWEGLLTDEELWDVAAYVRSLQK